MGYGKTKPAAAGSTDTARDQNRRVEFAIVGEEAQGQTAAAGTADGGALDAALPARDAGAAPDGGPAKDAGATGQSGDGGVGDAGSKRKAIRDGGLGDGGGLDAGAAASDGGRSGGA